MSRKLRLCLPEHPHLVSHRGHNGSRVFLQPDDYHAYLATLDEAAQDSSTRIHAFSLLPDSIHLLCTPTEPDGTSRLMQDLGRRYVAYFNRNQRRSGALWDGRYRVCVIEPGRFVLAGYRYVENTPVMGGLVRQPEEYSWSSAFRHRCDRSYPWIEDHVLYRALGCGPGERRRAYLRLLDTPLSSRLVKEIEVALVGGLVLGSETFKDELERTFNRRVRRGQPGRPRKPQPPSRAPTLCVA